MKLTEITIIKTVADYFNVPIDKVLSTCRKKEYIKARQVSMYFIRKYFNKLSLREIGEHFNGRNKYKDHSTVLFSVRSVRNEIDTNKYYKKDIENIDCLFNSDVKIKVEHPSAIEVQESILIYENKHLRELAIELKNKISTLQGVIYGMKLNRRRTIKKVNPFREIEPMKIEPEKTIDKEPAYVRPFENIPAEKHYYKSCVI